MRLFRDRRDAGKQLAQKFEGRSYSEAIVLALPRGGVPVAEELARDLNAELDVFLVRKLGTPFQEELAMGAIASGDVRILNNRLIDAYSITNDEIEEVTEREKQELERRDRKYRAGRAPLRVKNRTTILVDDGLATGSTMMAAIEALRKLRPAEIIVAVPVAPPDTARKIAALADEVVCVSTPESFSGVGQWYENFEQTEDDEVMQILDKRRSPEYRPWTRAADGNLESFKV